MLSVAESAPHPKATGCVASCAVKTVRRVVAAAQLQQRNKETDEKIQIVSDSSFICRMH